MKKILIGALTCLFVLTMTLTGCEQGSSGGGGGGGGGGSSAKIKIVNNYTQEITGVRIQAAGLSKVNSDTENIAANGGSKTYDIDLGRNVSGANSFVYVYAVGLSADDGDGRGPYTVTWNCDIEVGKTTTVTLNADKSLTVQK